jgi:hypothetical protein
MLTTSSQNQSKPDASAATTLQPANRNKHRSTWGKSSLRKGLDEPIVTASKVNVPAIKIVAAMCTARATISDTMSTNFTSAGIATD